MRLLFFVVLLVRLCRDDHHRRRVGCHLGAQSAHDEALDVDAHTGADALGDLAALKIFEIASYSVQIFALL